MTDRIYRYDGIIFKKDEKGRDLYHLNIHDAIESEKNPRGVFLLGQLYVELLCDRIISLYFNIPSGQKLGVFDGFLNSERVTFESKIKLIREMVKEKTIVSSKAELKPTPLFEDNIITSLKAVGVIRNAFQHNLMYADCLKRLKSSNKFVFIREAKTLDTYNQGNEVSDVEMLANDFKIEVVNLYVGLNAKILELGKE